jgi:low temperature requirement protein LtrA
LVEVVGQLITYTVWTPPSDQGGALFAATPSLIERLGLFVIIVLGEVIVGAVDGMAALDPVTRVIGLLGVLVAIGLWWIYFDLVSHHDPTPTRTQLWLYLHLPLVISMAAVGAGVLNAVEHSAESLPANVRWLLVGSLTVAVASVAALIRTLMVRDELPALYRTATLTPAGSAILIAAIGTVNWGAKGTLGAMVLVLGVPIAVGLYVWARGTDAPDLTFEEPG